MTFVCQKHVMTVAHVMTFVTLTHFMTVVTLIHVMTVVTLKHVMNHDSDNADLQQYELSNLKMVVIF